MRMILHGTFLLTAVHGFGQSSRLTATEIMARVASNQDRLETARLRYVYTQHAQVISRKGRSVQCEEITDTRITPLETGSTRTLLRLSGRVLRGRNYVTYDQLPKSSRNDHTPRNEEKLPNGDLEEGGTDQDLVENLRANLTNDKSKNGLHAGLFPLTSKAQTEYTFSLKGQERKNGSDTFHVAFAPRDKSEYDWRGDVWVDTETFQPVVVQTALSRNLPFAVRTLLGTSLPGLGFAATYASQDGVWFPVSFGTEFKLNVLFFFHRTITMSVVNRDFEKTHVTSRIVDDASAEPLVP